MATKLYQQRDIEALSVLYFKHIDAMTREGLYSKGEIAAELAFRDARIEELEKALNEKSNQETPQAPADQRTLQGRKPGAT